MSQTYTDKFNQPLLGESNNFPPLKPKMSPMDILKLTLLWVGWISVILFLVLVFISWLSSKNIKSELDEIELTEKNNEGTNNKGTNNKGTNNEGTNDEKN